MGDIVAQLLEALMSKQMFDVASCAGKEVIDTQHLAARLEQPLAKMRTEKARPARNENATF